MVLAVDTSGSKCSVSFEKRYGVIGATEAYYVEPSQTMPTVSQEAMGTPPGWEDWDNDGNPGYTLNVSGLAPGQDEAGGEAFDVPLEGAEGGLVEVVDVEDEAAVGAGEGAEVANMGVAAELAADAGVG